MAGNRQHHSYITDEIWSLAYFPSKTFLVHSDYFSTCPCEPVRSAAIAPSFHCFAWKLVTQLKVYECDSLELFMDVRKLNILTACSQWHNLSGSSAHCYRTAANLDQWTELLQLCCSNFKHASQRCIFLCIILLTPITNSVLPDSETKSKHTWMRGLSWSPVSGSDCAQHGTHNDLCLSRLCS